MPFSILSSFQSIQIHRDSSQSFSIRLSLSQDRLVIGTLRLFPIHSTSFCAHSSLFPTISISLSFTFNFPFISLLSLFKGLQVFRSSTSFTSLATTKNVFFHCKSGSSNKKKPTIMNCLYIFAMCLFSYKASFFLWVASTMMMRTSTGVFVPNVLPCFNSERYFSHS